MKKNAVIAYLLIIAIALFAVSAKFYLDGQDKLNNYYNSENYPSLNRNAYVGGDAYNYIINGNYATGYFVLSVGCLVAGIINVCTCAILGALPNKNDQPVNKSEAKEANRTQSPNTVKCLKCGADNDMDSKFCSECGFTLITRQTSDEHFNSEKKDNSNFNNECGSERSPVGKTCSKGREYNASETDISSTYMVILNDIGANKAEAIRIISEVTGAGLADAETLSERLPQVIATALSKEESEAIRDQFEAIGCYSEILSI